MSKEFSNKNVKETKVFAVVPGEHIAVKKTDECFEEIDYSHEESINLDGSSSVALKGSKTRGVREVEKKLPNNITIEGDKVQVLVRDDAFSNVEDFSRKYENVLKQNKHSYVVELEK